MLKSFTIILISISLYSCNYPNSTQEESVDTKVGNLTISNNIDVSFLTQIKEINNNLTKKNGKLFKISGEQPNFDFTDMKIVTSENMQGYTVVANEKDYDKTHSISGVSYFFNEKKELIDHVLVRVDLADEQLNRVDYIDENGEILLQTIINKKESNLTFIGGNKFNGSKLNKIQTTWGEATAQCIGDAYSNHGWLSVWATIQTAYIPATAAGIAAACAIKNY